MDYKVKHVVFLWRKKCGVCDLGDKERKYHFVLFSWVLEMLWSLWNDNVKQACLTTSLEGPELRKSKVARGQMTTITINEKMVIGHEKCSF